MEGAGTDNGLGITILHHDDKGRAKGFLDEEGARNIKDVVQYSVESKFIKHVRWLV